jgi:hypothetical protein
MEVFFENFPSNPADLDDFHSKSCIEGQNRKNKSTGSNLPSKTLLIEKDG